MRKHPLDSEQIKRASLYITAAVLCVVILCLFLKIWRADLRIPFYYSGDANFYAVSTKGIIENGWYWQNPSLGAPGGQQMYEFPNFDNGVVLLLLLLSALTHNPFVVMNLYYLLSFPLVTLMSLYVFRQFNLSYVPALFCSLLYAFLPHHFMRNVSALSVAAYYVVPPAVMVALWLIREDLTPRTKKFIGSVLVCILLGSSGIYFPFFFCYLLLIAGIIGSLKLRRLRPIAMASVFIVITTTAVVINLSPSLIHRYKYGEAGVTLRNPGEAERYGLKISQLILPITGHRVALLDRLKTYHNGYTIMGDGEAASLGLVGSIGFLGLLAQLLHPKEGNFQDLSMLNIAAVLLGVAGGFGFIVALLLSSGIRGYNRISIFIAFFSLMAIGIGLDWIYRRTGKDRVIVSLLIAGLFIVAFLDQTTSAYLPKYESNKAEFVSDAEFVQRIEAGVPAGAMIFQLPYVPFPEQPGLFGMEDYDHFRGYLHSKNLRWSYGTVKNREGDRAQQHVAELPVEEFLKTLVFGGFSGIYLDRFGYQDGGAAKQTELSNLLQAAPLISPNNRLLFFNLTDYGRKLRANYSDTEWEAQRQVSFHPVFVDWKAGCYAEESRPGKSWRWCSSDGELVLNNTSQRARTVKLEMSFATGHDQLDDFIVSGLISEQLKVSSSPSYFSKTVTVPPGESIVHFRSTAKRVDAPGDTRVLVFRIEDFKMTELQ